jgi:hypothetical protein
VVESRGSDARVVTAERQPVIASTKYKTLLLITGVKGEYQGYEFRFSRLGLAESDASGCVNLCRSRANGKGCMVIGIKGYIRGTGERQLMLVVYCANVGNRGEAEESRDQKEG